MVDGGTPLAIAVTPHAGRSYYSTQWLPAGTCVLDILTPYACTLYKRFRNEVCAECWKYDGGRRAFLTCRDFGEGAGLLFCDTQCKDAWMTREGVEMVELLKTLESARIRRAKGKERAITAGIPAVPVAEDRLDETWTDIESRQNNLKELKQWRQIQLDDFQADMARYVLMALYHYARECSQSSQCDVAASVSLPYGATWSDFSALQSNEIRQVSKFPELLDDHVKIFQVLKSRFGHFDGSYPSTTFSKLAEVITPINVRVALSVDPGNSFGIWEVPITDESEGLGFAVYPVPSFFNHRMYSPAILSRIMLNDRSMIQTVIQMCRSRGLDDVYHL